MLLALRRFFGFARVEETASSERRLERWVIEPTRLGYLARFEEIWRYRRILLFFSKRAIKERYEGTTLGIFWLFARPLMPIALSTIVFGRMLDVPSDGVPYFLFFLTGMSVWRMFERSMLWVTKSVEGHRGLIKKVYFPRLLSPISSVAPAITEFLVLFSLLVGASLVYLAKDHVMYLRVGPQMLVAVLAFALAVLFTVALGLFTSVLQTRHRDVQYSVRYVMQFWHYLTPVIYPLSAVPPKYRFIMYLNPMAPLVETYKWGMLGVGEFPTGPFIAGIAVTLVTLVLGLIYFDRSEAGSVDKL